MPLWHALLLLTAFPAHAAPVRADLSAQFPNTCRAQGSIGSCHAFASVALLEAAVKRRGGGEIELSDSDLFVRSGLLSRHRLFEFSNGDYKIALFESGDPYDNLNVALKTGVAYRKSATWEDFASAFERSKKTRERQCSLINKESDPACRRQAAADYTVELNKGTEDQERELLGDPEPLKKDRAAVLALLSGLKLERLVRLLGDFEKSDATEVSDKSVCREKGRKQTEVITKLLDGGTPAAVCFALDNLPGWDAEPDKPGAGSHCAVVYAYATAGHGAAERRVFKLRNSWGKRFSLASFSKVPVTHDIDEGRACAIHSMIWLTP